MDNRCIRCGNPAAYPVRALEVRTLHVRGIGGERRVQALGSEKESAVCERCARDMLDLSLHPFRAVRKPLLCFGAVFAAGIVAEAVAFLFLNGQRVFVLVGIAALICGILGIVDAAKKAREKERELRALPESEALKEAAWDVFVSEAPKREDVNDLTYIPIDEKTLKRKNGDLMILYSLLPEIAVQAWNRLHPSPETAEGKKEVHDDPTHCDVQDQG